MSEILKRSNGTSEEDSEKTKLLKAGRIFSYAYKRMWERRLSLSRRLGYMSETDPRRSEIKEELESLEKEMEKMRIEGKDKII